MREQLGMGLSLYCIMGESGFTPRLAAVWPELPDSGLKFTPLSLYARVCWMSG